jgi:hypothetical protein
MFPDVFESSPSCKQTLQMSSFYETHDKMRAQSRPQLKMSQQQQQQQQQQQVHPHGFGHISTVYQANVNTNKDPVDPDEVDISDTTHTVGILRNGSTSAYTTRQPLPVPLRRIAKFTITPSISVMSVVFCLILNIFASVAIPENINPSMMTQWGVFLYLWPFVTLIQLVPHSVYLCTPLTVWLSVLHLGTVAVVAVLPIHILSLFSFSMTLVVVCTIIALYQSVVFCLVYSHVARQWGYAILTSIFIILPTTQLTLIDYIDKDTTNYSSLLSAVSIFSMYAIAIVNGSGALTVDVSIAPNPTWLQE